MALRSFVVTGRFTKSGEQGSVTVTARSRDDAWSDGERLGLEVDQVRAMHTIHDVDVDDYMGLRIAPTVLRRAQR
ncbi:MAG: hypothetical protein WD009_10435 [Phycisphaeraceae bacterium]